MSLRSLTAIWALVAVLRAPAAFAEPSDPPSLVSELTPAGWKSVAWFLGGAATAFITHEGCHTIVNYALGSSPHIEKVTFLGFIPFFSIAPNVSCFNGTCIHDDSGKPWGPGPRGMYSIVTAGMQCQQMEDEVILSTDPQLLHRTAPFRKGLLAFNTLLSIGYAVSNWAGIEPTAGDLAAADRLMPFRNGILAASVFVPAVVDIARFFFPDVGWLPWVSRTSKGAIIGFVFAL